MIRDLMLSGVLGAATGGLGTYVLHRALWKASDQQARRIEALLPAGSVAADEASSGATSAKVRLRLSPGAYFVLNAIAVV
jgi:tetrahydromethanopterin S-methyltransferase subunit D